MKKLTILIFALLFTQISAWSQPCLPEGIIFAFQVEIDNFQINYPGCTEIEGDVEIGGDDITNLNGLSVLSSIGGSLQFGEWGYWGIIHSNPALESLSGLNNLTSIGGDLRFNVCEALIDLTGLINLTSIGGNLQIFGAESLINLSGLENLTFVGGDLTIGDYQALGLYQPENFSLTSLTGLDNLAYVGGDLGIYRNDILTSITGLDGLTAIGGSLGIGSNHSLTSLAGLDNLTTIGGDFIIGGEGDYYSNSSLVDLTGLENLTSIEGNFIISYNQALTGLTGLDNIQAESISDLHIYNNSSLSTCEILSVCSYLASPNGAIDIHDNAPGCNSAGEVLEACEALSCLPEGIIFTFQVEIDNFQINYPGCTEIEGDVKIDGDWITNLNGLNVLTSIGGNLEIGHMEIYGPNGCQQLTSLTGLENLTSIGGYLQLIGNENLVSLSGLENLTSIEGSLIIGWYFTGLAQGGNPSLVSMTGLANVTFIGGNIGIYNNEALLSLTGLEGLSSVEGDFELNNSISLTSLTGLEGLTSIAGDLNIGGPCNGIGQGGNDSIVSLAGLDNLFSIGGDLIISKNIALTSLSGLENLTSIGGDLTIGGEGILGGGNICLASLTALANLSYIGENLEISGNDSLISLEGLDNVQAETISDLSIIDNSSLSTCEVFSVCSYLDNPNGTIEIHDNAPGCNSPEEVDSLCNIVTVQEINFEETFTISPNPIEHNAVITYTLNERSHVTLKILDLSGREIKTLINEIQQKGEQKIEFYAGGLLAGVYFCVLKTNQGIQTRKLIKVE